MGTIQERYHGTAMAANTTFTVTGNSVAGFICVTAGTLTITRADGTTILVNALPVSAGVYYPLPILVAAGATVTLASGASGTILR